MMAEIMLHDLQKEGLTKEAKSYIYTPMMFDFNYMVSKIKHLKGVNSIYQALPESRDVLQIYIFTNSEDLDLETEITKLYTDWEITYGSFPEFHIFSLESDKSKEDYLPENAVQL